MEAILEKIERALAATSVPGESGRVAIAYSGGLDSTVLLAAMARLRPPATLRALHIDHGLHVDSAAWSEHCRLIAADLGVEFDSRRVKVDTRSGESTEAAARDARYAALGRMLLPDELLLTAHHRDDQLETVLLRLFRGSGVRGLRGIEPHSEFRGIRLARPLLEVSREAIRAAADSSGLGWLEDPTNSESSFDRNYLRHDVIPLLRARWPGVATTASRAARQMGAAQKILDSVAVGDSAGFDAPDRLSQSALLELSPERRANVLRYWIRENRLPNPSAVQLNELMNAIEVLRPDATTRVVWPGAEARIYRDILYLFAPMAPESGPDYEGRLARDSFWRGPEGCIELHRTSGEGLPDAWVQQGLAVRFRAGGERFKPLHDAHSRSLKKWLQVEGIVPWMRSRIPLLYRGSSLVAVGDLVISDDIRQAESDGPAWAVRWSDHPSLT
ncbi:MAG: tRNA lysidine(34) synthetase TilS [Gammaproteobacteria bacterium]